jgi:hypothetical protein
MRFLTWQGQFQRTRVMSMTHHLPRANTPPIVVVSRLSAVRSCLQGIGGRWASTREQLGHSPWCPRPSMGCEGTLEGKLNGWARWVQVLDRARLVAGGR